MDYSKIYEKLDRLEKASFKVQRNNDSAYIHGKNFTVEVHLTKKDVILELVVTFDKRHQLTYQIDNDLYDLEKYNSVTAELLESMRLLLSGLNDGSVKYGYMSKRPTLLVKTSSGHEIVYSKWFFTTKKKIDRETAKEYSRLLNPLN